MATSAAMLLPGLAGGADSAGGADKETQAQPEQYNSVEAAGPVDNRDRARPKERAPVSIWQDVDPQEDPLGFIAARIAASEHEAVKPELRQRIQEAERTHHRYHESLVVPVTLLGDAHFASGDFGEALNNYQRAVHLSRVSSGLSNPDQVAVVYREASAYLKLGDIAQANNREEYAFEVLQRSHGRYHPALIPGAQRLADWYLSVNDIFAARSLYDHSLRIFEANGKAEHPEIIPTLRGVALTYRLERFPPFYVAELDDGSTVSQQRA